MKTFRAQGKAARGLTRHGNTSEGKWGPESGPGLRLLSKVDVGSLTAHTSRHHQVGVRLWEAAGLRSRGEEGAVWRSPQTSQSRALTLGHHRSCWVPRKTQFWGPWAAQRPGTSCSQSWTLQTRLDVSEELRIGGGPQEDSGLEAEGKRAGGGLRGYCGEEGLGWLWWLA